MNKTMNNNSSEFAPAVAMEMLKAFLNPTNWVSPEKGIEVDYFMPGASGNDQLGSAQEAVDYVLGLMHTNQQFQVLPGDRRIVITGNDCRLEFYYYQTERKTPFNGLSANHSTTVSNKGTTTTTKTMNKTTKPFNTTSAIQSLESRGWGATTIEESLDGTPLTEQAIDTTLDLVGKPEWVIRWTLSNLLNLDELISRQNEELLFSENTQEVEIYREVLLPKAGIALNMNDTPVDSKDAMTNKIIKLMNHTNEDYILIQYLDDTNGDGEWITHRINLTEKGTMNKPITKIPGNWKEETVERAQKSGKNGFKLFVKTQEQRREFLSWYYEQFPTKEGRLYINVIVKPAKPVDAPKNQTEVQRYCKNCTVSLGTMDAGKDVCIDCAIAGWK